MITYRGKTFIAYMHIKICVCMGVVSCMCQPLILLFSLQTPLFHPLPHPRKKARGLTLWL